MKKLRIVFFSLFLLLGVANATQANNTNVTKLYVATFDRAPDSSGLDYWVNLSKLSLEDIATSFFDQSETKVLYPNGFDNYDFILAIYKNLFKRTPDSAGSDYWQGELSSGSVSKSVFILAVVNGAKGDDATILQNKTEVGLKFVNSKSSDTQLAKNVMENVTSNRQTVTDSFNKISKINVNGNNNSTVSNGNLVNGNGNNISGGTTNNDNSKHIINNNDNSKTTNIGKIDNSQYNTTIINKGENSIDSNKLEAIITETGTYTYSAENSTGSIVKYEWIVIPRKDAQGYGYRNNDWVTISNSKGIRIETYKDLGISKIFDEFNKNPIEVYLPYGNFDLALKVIDNNGKVSITKKTIKIQEDIILAYIDWDYTDPTDIFMDTYKSRATADNIHISTCTFSYEYDEILEGGVPCMVNSTLEIKQNSNDNCWYIKTAYSQDKFELLTCDELNKLLLHLDITASDGSSGYTSGDGKDLLLENLNRDTVY